MKNYKIIQTQNYLLVVDETLSLDGLDRKPVVTYHKQTKKPDLDFFYEEDLAFYAFKPSKIIAHLPLNNSPVLEGVDLLPENVQFPAIDIPFKYTKQKEVEDYLDGFKDGYKAATKTYTEEDLHKAFYEGREVSVLNEHRQIVFKYPTFNGWLRKQSFNKPKLPVGFEAEYNKSPLEEMMPEMEGRLQFSQVKTIPNEQGIPVWQGTYLY